MKHPHISFIFLFITILFIGFESFAEDIIENSRTVKITVTAEPARSIGFFALELLSIKSDEIALTSRFYQTAVISARNKIDKNQIDELSDFHKRNKTLKNFLHLKNLAYVPFIFGKFRNAVTAFNILEGKGVGESENQFVQNTLQNVLYVNDQSLAALSKTDKEIVKDFENDLKVLYKVFFNSFFDSNNPNIKAYTADFEKEWDKKFLPAVNALNIDDSLEKIQIVLTPVLTKFNFILRCMTSANKVISLLPANEAEIQFGLWQAYYEICYNLAVDFIETSNSKNQFSENNSDDFLLLQKHITNQLMYEGLRATNSELLDEFYNTEFGNIQDLADGSNLEQSFKLIGKKASKEEIKELKNSIKNHPKKTAQLFFNSGILVPKDFFNKFREKIKGKLEFEVNSDAAVDMYRVLLAIHSGDNIEIINKLIDKAFKNEAYKLVGHDYTTKYEDKSSRVSLADFRKFLVGLSENEITPLGNSSLQGVATNYVDAISNPSKYLMAIEEYNSIPISLYKNVLEHVERWLPKKFKDERIHIWLLFNMKPNIQTFENNIYVDVFSCLNKNGNVDEGLYARALGYIVYKLVYNKLDIFKKKIDYSNLPDNSKLKMVTFFLDKFVRVGIATKISFNVPGILSERVSNNTPSYWVADDAQKVWSYFDDHSLEIFKNAQKFIENILDGKYKTFDDMVEDYDDYWIYYRGGPISSRIFDIGNRYFLGCEVMGSIYQAFGKQGVENAVKDLLQVIPMFNKALEVTKPKNYKEYLFSDNIVEKLNYDYLSKESVEVQEPTVLDDISLEEDKNGVPNKAINEQEASKKKIRERNIGTI